MTTSPHRFSPSAPPATPGTGRPLRADDSGLVDLRALRALQGLDAGPEVDRSGLRAVGGAARGFEPSSLAPPVLATRVGPDRGLLVAGLSAGSILVAGAIVAAAIWFAPQRVAPPPTVAAPMPELVPAGVGAGEPADAQASPDQEGPAVAQASATVAVAPTAGDAPAGTASEEQATAGPEARRTDRRGRTAARAVPAKTADRTVAEPAPARERSLVETDRIIDLVDRALTNDPGVAAAAPAAREALPETPDRGAVARALRDVEDEVRACAEGASGILWTSLTVEGATGRVSRALVTGAFAGTPAGACAARAVRDVQLPRFARETMDVRFPFPL